MEMKITGTGTKKFTKEEKLSIIEEAGKNGVKVTLQKYGLYPATYYYWKKKLLIYGEEGLNHRRMKSQRAEIKRLEKENESLKILLAEKELESKLKDELLKKKPVYRQVVSRVEKEALVRNYMAAGLKRDQCLRITGLTKNQFYYVQKGTKPGRRPSDTTVWRDPSTLIKYEVDNRDVVQKIVEIKLNPDHTNWYRMIGVTLQILGYYINHKKVYRLMLEYILLEDPRKRTGREFVKYRRAIPEGPLRILEMDIKYIWVYERRKYAYILTVIDTFTRYVLHWSVGYTMKSEQVKVLWEYIIAEYLQPAKVSTQDVEIEIRNDNGKQFNSNLMADFFKENQLHQVFTHPYTPEENGHVESFHHILGKALKKDQFTTLMMLEQRLEKFYTCYNNDRSHSGTKGIPPAKFWALYELNKIEVIPLEKWKVKFKLKVAYQDILTIPSIDKYDYRAIRS